MTSRTWAALALGLVLGWGARWHHSSDRYIRALAEKHEAAERYYNARADQIINTEQPKPKGAKTP